MIDIIRRSFLIGVGAMAITRDRLEQFITESVSRGELSREQGKTLLDEMAQRADQERDRVERFVRQQVSHVLDTAGLASREDISRLDGRIDNLESRLRDLSFSVASIRAGESGGSGSQPDSAEPSEDTARSGNAAITITPGRADAGTAEE